MSQILYLSCDADPKDKLEVVGHNKDVVLRVEQADPDSSIAIYLNAESTRALFNWLGVWLHGGNRL